jgi:hypothetical protein
VTGSKPKTTTNKATIIAVIEISSIKRYMANHTAIKKPVLIP